MSFTFDDSLAPEVYPLAWLVGTWRGPGELSYPGIERTGLVADLVVEHDGGPYLSYDLTLRTHPVVDPMTPVDLMALTPGEIWARESGFWRTAPGVEAEPVAGAPAGSPEPTAVECLLSDPAGVVGVLTGSAQGPRIDLASDWLAGSPSSVAKATAMRRMYGWVRGTIYWAHDLAAFGHELQSYASGRLVRVEAADLADSSDRAGGEDRSDVPGPGASRGA